MTLTAAHKSQLATKYGLVDIEPVKKEGSLFLLMKKKRDDCQDGLISVQACLLSIPAMVASQSG
ncbi:MAG: hypothetical protein MUO26_09730 [Methanotrichaceae archaeon]|nr:hypothetical protein [Methanotrichaceae archaeon]